MNNIVEMIYDKHIGNYYAIRGNKSNKAFKNPMTACKLVKLNCDDVVVDIGAFVGEYSLLASSIAKKVISYEASPETFKVLKMNQKQNMEIFNKAVVGGNEATIELFLSKGIGATNSVVKSKGKASAVKVDAINYVEAVRNATVVKIDVEGAEYSYDIIQPNLRAIILEFHPIVGCDWKKNAQDIMKKLIRSGFQPLMIPKFQNGWDTNSSWVKI